MSVHTAARALAGLAMTILLGGTAYARGYNYYSRVIDFGNGAPSDNIVLALSRETTGRPEFNIFPSGQALLAPDPIPLNEWVHVAVTVKTNTAIMYVNGVAVVSGPAGTPNPVVRNNNYIGRSNWPGDAYANALIDELRIWDVARTPSELQASSSRPKFFRGSRLATAST